MSDCGKEQMVEKDVQPPEELQSYLIGYATASRIRMTLNPEIQL